MDNKMNIRDNIRRILREETEIPLFVRRRFTLEDLKRLVNEVKEMIDDGDDLDTAVYDGIREFIKSKNFPDIDEFGLDADYWSTYLDYERPLVRYVKSKLNIRESILREETRPLKAMRRTHLIDSEIARLFSKVYTNQRICERYGDADMFVRVVTEAIVENLYFNTFYMMDDTSEEWEKSVDFIYDYIKDSYGEKLKDYYNKMCNIRGEIDESELTERCWKGYTQKGMKTMFGKRYPNCVKKKKK